MLFVAESYGVFAERIELRAELLEALEVSTRLAQAPITLTRAE